MNESVMSWSEFLSYVVTVIGFPFAIAMFMTEKRRERLAEEEEIHQRLSDEYVSFLRLALENADLQLLRREVRNQTLTEEQNERKYALFEIVVSLFERAFILVHEERMDRQRTRIWSSWEDYMREWCRRGDFRTLLPTLLQGEDEDFGKHILRIAAAEAVRTAPTPVVAGNTGGNAP